MSCWSSFGILLGLLLRYWVVLCLLGTARRGGCRLVVRLLAWSLKDVRRLELPVLVGLEGLVKESD